jgi:BlaI family penicillinase repressor
MLKELPKPTESELEILQVLWHAGPCAVRHVHEKLCSDGRDIGYTTTLKLMQIMSEKGLVIRNTDARSHIYKAAVPEQAVQGQLLRRFVDTAFRGSAMNLVMQALGQHQADAEELAQIKALIQEMEAGERGISELKNNPVK